MRQVNNSIQAARLKAFDRYFGAADSRLRLDRLGIGIPEAWFLGPKAENEYLLLELVLEAICKHCDFRREFHPEDPIYITKELKQSPEYMAAIESLRRHAATLFEELQKSVPFFSMRYQSHMLWDQALPAMIGYIGAMLYNQNNVAAEASPMTTRLEIDVGNDLCRMLGFDVPSTWPPKPGTIVPWGHITCDGSVANIEGLWAARNAKFFALALREALHHDPRLREARTLEVKLLGGGTARLIDIDEAWVLLNLKIDDVVRLPQAMKEQFSIDPSITNTALGSYAVQNIGIVEFYNTFLSPDIRTPIVIVPSTAHYSWPKAGTLLGLGQNNIKKVFVDLQAHMDVARLKEELANCLNNKVPVIAVVAVIGSTEESAVDPLREILNMREEFRQEGLDFAIHCDAAWGGYFNSLRIPPATGPSAMVPTSPERVAAGPQSAHMRRLAFLSQAERMIAAVPGFPMSEYVNKQYEALRDADSVTVDPHKAGYVPYPAGAVCYRNSAMRDLISLRAPVVFHNENEPTVGIYGIEGSKPGAAAAAVWLAHKVIPPTQSGYGKILGQCIWTSKRLYCRLVTMRERDNDPPYKVVVFQMLPAERDGNSEVAVAEQKRYIADNFVERTNQELIEFLTRDSYASGLFRNIGSDQVILAYTFNFRDKSGTWNTDIRRMKQLNDEMFNICSVTDPATDVNAKKLILTSSAFDVDSYGEEFVGHYCSRLGVANPNKEPIPFLISTSMGPWTTDTPGGDFLGVVEQALREAVCQALRHLGY